MKVKLQMPEQSISRGKYNFNKQQKEKQNKIIQYYRRSFKSQLAPVREITRQRRTRKQRENSIANGTGRIPKLTRTNMLDENVVSKDASGKELESKNELQKDQKINLEKTESGIPPNQKGGENQYVIMD